MSQNKKMATRSILIFAASAIITTIPSYAAEPRTIIENQSFQVQLSELTGNVQFTSYNPSPNENDATFTITTDSGISETLETYVPASIGANAFSSVDAISFVDYNYDGNTDILIVKSWQEKFAFCVYDGMNGGGAEHFVLNRELSDTATSAIGKPYMSNLMVFLKNEVARESGNDTPQYRTEAGAYLTEDGLLPEFIPSEFFFSSGAGAWGMGLTLQKNGEFEGYYHKTNNSDRGEGYDYSVSGCHFWGKFSNIRVYNQYCYAMEMTEFYMERTPGDQQIVEGTDGPYLDIATTPNGINTDISGETYYILLEDSPISELPIDMSEGGIGMRVTDEEPRMLMTTVLCSETSGKMTGSIN